VLRTISSHLSFDVGSTAELFLAIAVADGAYDRFEHLIVTHEDAVLEPVEIKTHHGARIHRVHAPAGRVVVDYHAQVTGYADLPPVEDMDIVEYRRPSRYADSDKLLAFSRQQFAGLKDVELLTAVVAWVSRHLAYVPGSSLPTDAATDTLLTRRGVCRDFAHLVVALLRAKDVPARFVSVYAPGLEPMDFHAVVEAHVGGGWHVVDATALAPIGSLLRIATGRDATDTAFLSSYHGGLTLRTMTVTAVTQPDGAPDAPAPDDGTRLAVLR
jgi:transglutaminase-like putative cysteine protease